VAARVAGILRALESHERSTLRIPSETSTRDSVVSFRLCNGFKSGHCNGASDECGVGLELSVGISFIDEDDNSFIADSSLDVEKISEVPFYVIGNALVSFSPDLNSFVVNILTYGENEILMKHNDVARVQPGGRSVSAVSLDESKILERSHKSHRNTIHLHSACPPQRYFKNVAFMIASRLMAANKIVELTSAWSSLLSIPILISTKFSAYSAPAFSGFCIDLLMERSRSQRLGFMDNLASKMFKIISNNKFSNLFSSIQASFGGKCIFCFYSTFWKVFIPGRNNSKFDEPFFAFVLVLSQFPRESYVVLLDSLPVESEPDDYFEQHAKIQEKMLEKIVEIMLSSLLLSVD
jgi:hypothetical protein